MTPCCTSRSRQSGFTLIELLVTVLILAVVVGGLCDVFIANQMAWDRQSGASFALSATNDALADLGRYVGNAMEVQTYNRFSMGDVLVLCLPSDSAYGIYIPTHYGYWGYSAYLHYDRGQIVVFYLSDSTGSYARRGDILWAGTMSVWATPSSWNVTPDASWSLSPGTTRGRIAPIRSVQFARRFTDRYSSVDMTVTSSYSEGSATAPLSRTRTVCLRSQSYR